MRRWWLLVKAYVATSTACAKNKSIRAARRIRRGVVIIYRALARPPKNLVCGGIDAFSEPVSLSDAAARLSDAIDRAGLQHVELGGGGRQDYRYAILALMGGNSTRSPDPDNPDYVVDAHDSAPYHIFASDLRCAINTYLDALGSYHTPPPLWRGD